MITAEELYHTLHRKPFRPFRVFVKDGRVFDIRYHRNNVVGVDYFVIGIPSIEDPEFIADRTVRVPIELIDRVEGIGDTTATVPT